MHSFAFSCLQLVQEDPAQLGKLRGVLGRAAKLGRDLVDRLRRDGAVLVAQVGVLRLLDGGHHLGWHVVAHGCYIGTPSGTPAARPAHIRPCLALSPLGVSCVCVDHESGAFVRICAHSNAFKCIVVHSHAS